MTSAGRLAHDCCVIMSGLLRCSIPRNSGSPILTLTVRSDTSVPAVSVGAVMSARDLFTFNNLHFSASVGIAAGLFVLTAIGGSFCCRT